MLTFFAAAFDAVISASGANTIQTIYCVSETNAPADGIGDFCYQKQDAVAFATGSQTVVLCPVTWQSDDDPNGRRRVVIEQANREKDLTLLHIDQLLTVSGIVLHELLHLASWPQYLGEQPHMGIIDVEVTYEGVNGLQDRVAYRYVDCAKLALMDWIAQHSKTQGGIALDASAAWRTLTQQNGKATRQSSGMSVFNADNLRLAALQAYLIQH